MEGSGAFSTYVTIALHTSGGTFDVAKSASDFLVLREPTDIPAGDAVLEIMVDGQPWRSSVRVTDTSQSQSDRALVRITRL